MKGNNKVDLYSVKLASSNLPKVVIDYSRNIVKYGLKNDFCNYLLFLYENHSLHGGIINGKARYITGSGIKAVNETVNTQGFLNKANPQESWYQLTKKTDLDELISGGYFLKIISNVLGGPVQFYHLDFAKCRISPCQKFISYSNDWNKLYENPITEFPVWEKGRLGTSVYIYKKYTPSKNKLESTYPKPEYSSCINDIDTDIRIGSFGNNLVKNNFSAGTIVTVRNGETDKVKKEDQAKRLSFNHEGEDNAGKTVVIFGDKNTGATDIQSINTSDQDKQYVELNKRSQQNILTSHNVNGVLFKIKTEGQLGTLTEMVEAQELFLNEYVKMKQIAKTDTIEMFYKLRFNENVKFEIEQVDLIDKDLPIDNQNVINALNSKDPNIFINYLIDKYKIKTPKLETGVSAPGTANANLKSLTGREYQGMLRVVRDFDKGKTTRQQAVLLLMSGYGMTESEASTFLNENDEDETNNVKQSKSVKFFDVLKKYGHPINLDDETIDEQEFKANVQFNAETDKQVLNQIKGNPSITPEQISKNTGISIEQIIDSIDLLTSKKLIDSNGVTSKGLKKNSEVETEVYTEYVYDLRPGVSYSNRPNKINAKLLESSHEFCKEMILNYSNVAFSYEDIINMSNEFGQNVWDFRGGFTTQPGGKSTEPWCNHIWKAVTKIRRK